MVVIKVGGSLLGLAELERFLTNIKYKQFPIVLLPGGGKFADVVRQEQKQHGFSDKTSHKMAIHAMQQYAELLHELSGLPFYIPSVKLTSPVIFPPAQLLSYKWNTPENWTVTSDSLAILLAIELKADRCMLLKACEVIKQNVSIKELSAQGIIDEYSPNLLSRYKGKLHVISIQEFEGKTSYFF